jgi:hypothetical protein
MKTFVARLGFASGRDLALPCEAATGKDRPPVFFMRCARQRGGVNGARKQGARWGAFAHGSMSAHHRQCGSARDQGAVTRHVAMALRWQDGLRGRRLFGKTGSPGGLGWRGLRCCLAATEHVAGEGGVSIVAPLRQEALRPRRHGGMRRHGLRLRLWDGFEDRLAEPWILPARSGLRLCRRLREEATVLGCPWRGEGSRQRHHRHGWRWCRGHPHRRRLRWAGAKGRRRKRWCCRDRRGRGGHRRPAHRAGSADPGQMCRDREYMLAIAARKLEDLWVHDSRGDTMLDWSQSSLILTL